MADTASIAIRRDGALKRFGEAFGILAEALGIKPPQIPAYDRDAAYLEAWRLDVLSTYALDVAERVKAQPSDFSDADLLNLAAALAMNPPADVQRADLVQLIRAEVTPPNDEDAATATTEAPAVSPYASMTKAELQALADDRKLVVTGTGAQGNVLVDDLRAALDADDAAKAEGA